MLTSDVVEAPVRTLAASEVELGRVSSGVSAEGAQRKKEERKRLWREEKDGFHTRRLRNFARLDIFY